MNKDWSAGLPSNCGTRASRKLAAFASKKPGGPSTNHHAHRPESRLEGSTPYSQLPMPIVTLLLSSSLISKTHEVPRRRHFSRSIGWRIEEGSVDCNWSIAARLAIAVVRRICVV
jgi:hypothetical protein